MPTESYTVRTYPHGIAVFGRIPVGDMSRLLAGWAEDQLMKFIRTDITEALGASVAVVRSEAEAALWLAELGIRKDHPDWLKSGDTGISSKTIFAVLGARPDVFAGQPCAMDAPHDADDFGRCHRLLLRYPEWAGQLDKVAAACPSFGPLVGAWGELDGLFRAGDLKGVSKRTRELAHPGT
jgi:hypothetical protein